MGVLAPVSAQRDTLLSPPSTSAKIFRRACLHSNLQISPPTPENAYATFQNPKTTFGNYPPPAFYTIVRGLWVSLKFVGIWNINIYVT